MARLWCKLVEKFDSATAAFEAKTAEMEQDARQLEHEAAEIDLETAQIRAETEEIKSGTKQLFNCAVSELGIEIENAETPEKREFLRSLALQLYQSVSPR